MKLKNETIYMCKKRGEIYLFTSKSEYEEENSYSFTIVHEEQLEFDQGFVSGKSNWNRATKYLVKIGQL